jgi:tetratricopeptide (TPR) repeat protein
MNNLSENKELQDYASQVNDKLPEYCKSVIQDFIPCLKGLNPSDSASESIALAELEVERPKFVESVEKAFQKRLFSDVIFLAENLAVFYERRSYLDEWVDVSTYALEAAKNSRDVQSQAYILGMLGRVFRIKNMWAEATEYCKQSILIYDSLEEAIKTSNSLKIAKAEILDALGNINRSIGSLKSLKDAVKQFMESIQLFHEANNFSGELRALDGLAQVYTKQGKLNEAKNILEKLLQEKKEVGESDFSISITLNNLGKILRDMGMFHEAEQTFNEALMKKKKLLDWRGEAVTYHELGILKGKIGNVTDALEMFDQSLEIKRQRGDAHGQGLSLVEVGKLYAELGNFSQACEPWIQALANLTKESEQYKQHERLLLQEALEGVDFKELSSASLDVLKNLDMNPSQNQELLDLLSHQNQGNLTNDQQEQLEELAKTRDFYLLRRSQAMHEIARRENFR